MTFKQISQLVCLNQAYLLKITSFVFFNLNFKEISSRNTCTGYIEWGSDGGYDYVLVGLAN